MRSVPWCTSGAAALVLVAASPLPAAVIPPAPAPVLGVRAATAASGVSPTRAATTRVTPRVTGAVVRWRKGAAPFRVRLRTPVRTWFTVGRTDRRRLVVPDLSPQTRYRAQVLHRRSGDWRPIGRRSAWFRPLSAPTGAPTPDTSGPVVPDPTWAVDPGTSPPADAVVTWVSPTGDDDAPGTETRPVRTITEAWRRIPADTTLTAPRWIQLRSGRYAADDSPGYWENRRGTAGGPIVLNAADGPGTVAMAGDINMFGVTHLSMSGIQIVRDGDVFHCERCSHIQLRRMTLDGLGNAHETVKVNQSDHLLITDSDISGSYENAIDFVAVQTATISRNTIHHADDWCAYAKGGSVDITVTGNRIHHCGTGGFTAGQGTGFEFMVAPWLRYEAYAVTVTDNVIHDTWGAGLGVNGGANIVMAHNTLYRVGSRSHTVEFVHGSRSCDGDITGCRRHREAGGWGGPDLDGQWIPSRNIAFVNNLILNPDGAASTWAHLEVAGPRTPPPAAGVPDPSLADDGLVVRGNVFSNGGATMDSGWPGHDTEFQSQNRVNSTVVDLRDPERGDFRPIAGGSIATVPTVAVPVLPWADPTVPEVAPPDIDTRRPPGALQP